ncbi:DUF1353 domain-containing protein [Nocardioides sp. TF02-7]|uniref:DUF1353 domain-containing protein n=1 Tax=Nocardioides sp. TF02-7 TaxID=2917724 RepID=UPI001F06E541|nr:DUF1353 domain-containing protein [Nocardioides sp. TF02-7]UMG91512.1 DUF1353 domain-containing protein [Nocardioides sp. TF02-7]
MQLVPEAAHPDRFFDGGTTDGDVARDRPPRVVLERVVVPGPGGRHREAFRMLRRIGYRDDVVGEILVPRDPGRFTTDFASVPALFTWLVPRTGEHLPAALVHDGLVGGRDYLLPGRPDDGPGGPDAPGGSGGIDRVVADEVFRRAMRDSGIGPIRRWLIWSAVTLGTIWHGSENWSRARHLRYLLVAGLTLGLVAGLGVVATLDLLDVVAWLPWMGGGRPFVLELAGGLAGAIVIPLLLSVAWGRFAVAGAVAGIALAVLLHVTALLLAVTGLYRVAEWVARHRPVAGVVAIGLVLAASLVLTLLLVGTSG